MLSVIYSEVMLQNYCQANLLTLVDNFLTVQCALMITLRAFPGLCVAISLTVSLIVSTKVLEVTNFKTIPYLISLRKLWHYNVLT